MLESCKNKAVSTAILNICVRNVHCTMSKPFCALQLVTKQTNMAPP